MYMIDFIYIEYQHTQDGFHDRKGFESYDDRHDFEREKIMDAKENIPAVLQKGTVDDIGVMLSKYPPGYTEV